MAGEGARAHARVVKEILAKCGARDDCRLWSNNTGVARGLNHDGVIHFGLRGSADILGIYRGGYFMAFEVKTGRARQSKEQLAFAAMIRRFGGSYFVVSSADEVLKILDNTAYSCYVVDDASD